MLGRSLLPGDRKIEGREKNKTRRRTKRGKACFTHSMRTTCMKPRPLDHRQGEWVDLWARKRNGLIKRVPNYQSTSFLVNLNLYLFVISSRGWVM